MCVGAQGGERFSFFRCLFSFKTQTDCDGFEGIQSEVINKHTWGCDVLALRHAAGSSESRGYNAKV